MVYILTFARSGLQKLVEFVNVIEYCGNIVFITPREYIFNNAKELLRNTYLYKSRR